MPETKQPERSRPGRHQIGMVGEIISESWAGSNRYTPGEIIGIRSQSIQLDREGAQALYKILKSEFSFER